MGRSNSRAPLRSTTQKGLTVAHLKGSVAELNNMRKMVVWHHKTRTSTVFMVARKWISLMLKVCSKFCFRDAIFPMIQRTTSPNSLENALQICQCAPAAPASSRSRTVAGQKGRRFYTLRSLRLNIISRRAR